MGIKETFIKQGGVKLLKQYWRGGVLFTGIFEFILLGKSKTALEILRLATSLKTKQKLEKKYKWKLDELDRNFVDEKKQYEKNIWVCWMQGIENAPKIVQRCYESLKDNIVDRNIILITEKNYKKYIMFPDFIQHKIDKGIITGAHMSDLLRLELLDNYGGTWIDATVYCSSKNIPKYMLDSDLFLFQSLKPGKDGNASVISNWFITSKPHQKFIHMVKELLYEYWRKNNELVDYFIFHDFFQMIIDKYPDEWNKVIPVSNSTPHILLLRLFDNYNDAVWKTTTTQVPFHKLTHKYDDSETKKTNTFYKKIVGEI